LISVDKKAFQRKVCCQCKTEIVEVERKKQKDALDKIAILKKS
jgi:valyl-tRNA synthetase